MKDENILVTTDEAIATITFNRPKALNALNAALLAELSHAIDTIENHPEVRVLVLTGAGDKPSAPARRSLVSPRLQPLRQQRKSA